MWRRGVVAHSTLIYSVPFIPWAVKQSFEHPVCPEIVRGTPWRLNQAVPTGNPGLSAWSLSLVSQPGLSAWSLPRMLNISEGAQGDWARRET